MVEANNGFDNFRVDPTSLLGFGNRPKEEYRKVNVPMLPVTHGEKYTKLHILLYTVILIICSVLPYVIGMSNLFTSPPQWRWALDSFTGHF